jgi:hypothetical protein
MSCQQRRLVCRVRSAVVCAVSVCALLVGGTAGAGAAPRMRVSVGPTATASSVKIQLPGCAPGHGPLRRLRPGKLRGPAGRAVSDDRLVTAWSVDHGKLRVRPAGNVTPLVSRRQAACNLIAGINPNNVELAWIVRLGSNLALGRMSISPSVHATTNNAGLIGTRQRPAQYRNRLAWILTVQFALPSSCPNPGSRAGSASRVGATAPPSHRHGWDYQVYAIDANTGLAPAVYLESTSEPCGGPGIVPPSVAVPIELLSLPWQLEKENSSRTSATLTASYSPCRSIYVSDSTIVDSPKPVVGVGELRRYGPVCGTQHVETVSLSPPTFYRPIPRHLIHAIVGPVDNEGEPLGDPEL